MWEVDYLQMVYMKNTPKPSTRMNPNLYSRRTCAQTSIVYAHSHFDSIDLHGKNNLSRIIWHVLQIKTAYVLRFLGKKAVFVNFTELMGSESKISKELE